MGIRLLLVILTLWALFIIVRGYVRRSRKSTASRRKKVAENMVKCEVCGTYLPQGEALRQGDMFFCSREHMNQATHGKP